jgi:uncharacterized membrane protein YfcA
VTIGLLLIPPMLIGSVLGMKLHNKINENLFKKIVSLVMLIIAIELLILH